MGIVDRLRRSPRDRFGREVVAALHRAGIPEARYDADGFAVAYRKAPDDHEGGRVFLHNVFRESAGLGRAARQEKISRLIAGVVRAPAVPTGWDEVRPQLRPVLRSAHFGLVGPVAADTLLSRPALPHLREYVVMDRPTSMAYVTTAQASGWDRPPAEVFAAARANLAATSLAARSAAAGSGANEAPDRGGPAMLRYIDAGEGYFTSRLLLDGWLAGLAGEVGGRPVAFVPDRDTLIVVGDRPETLPGLYSLVEAEYSAAVRALSPQGYTVDSGGALIPYPAPADHPALAAAVRRADLLLLANEYAAQGEWLEGRSGDVFVAALSVIGRPDDSIFTVTSWAEGIESLLPRAEYVAFTAADREPFFVSWPDVAAEVTFDAEPDLSPPRYRVRGWPPPDAVTRLRARATRP